jgi:hypothetical protein
MLKLTNLPAWAYGKWYFLIIFCIGYTVCATIFNDFEKTGSCSKTTWKRGRRAVWDQVELSQCQHNGLVTVLDEALLWRGHNEQSRRGHWCSKTTLTGESRFHFSTPPRDWTRVPFDRKQTGGPLDQWNCTWMPWDYRLCRVSTF